MSESPNVKFKLAVVVRHDLRMGKGKLSAQVGHASVSASEITRKRHQSWWRGWLDDGQSKVILKVNTEDEIYELEVKARRLGLPVTIIRDRGLTQLRPDTLTCMGIGPGPTKLVDEVTGHLHLL